jgi:hypothetical protein
VCSSHVLPSSKGGNKEENNRGLPIGSWWRENLGRGEEEEIKGLADPDNQLMNKSRATDISVLISSPGGNDFKGGANMWHTQLHACVPKLLYLASPTTFPCLLSKHFISKYKVKREISNDEMTPVQCYQKKTRTLGYINSHCLLLRCISYLAHCKMPASSLLPW